MNEPCEGGVVVVVVVVVINAGWSEIFVKVGWKLQLGIFSRQ
jgi:hypothetical protein